MKYRYILNSSCSPDDSVYKFRLVSGNQLRDNDPRSYSGIRIKVNGIELHKCKYDFYSTTEDNTLIRDLSPVVFGFNKKTNKELTTMWLNKEIQPCDFFMYNLYGINYKHYIH